MSITNIRSVISLCAIIVISSQLLRWEDIGPKTSHDDSHGFTQRERDLNTIKDGILHVISPFKPSHCEDPFCPFDQEQSLVIASMIQAKERAPFPVTLAATTKQEDVTIIPKEFVALPPLSRTAASYYPDVSGMKDVPFIQDIFDRVIESKIQFDYVVYTNSDIILHKEFYEVVQSQIEKGYDAFTINRRMVPRGVVKDGIETLYTSEDLDKIFESEYRKHHGYDCFIIRKDLFLKINMGDIYLGAPPLARMMIIQLHAFGKKVRHHVSSTFNATYHISGDNSWIKPERHGFIERNLVNALCGMPELMSKCAHQKGLEGCLGLKYQLRKFHVGDLRNRKSWCRNWMLSKSSTQIN